MVDCDYPGCEADYPHYHDVVSLPGGSYAPAVVTISDRDPRAEVRDSETGEVIFPAVKGPLTLIEGGLTPTPSKAGEGEAEHG